MSTTNQTVVMEQMEDGSVRYTLNGLLHRDDDLPALISKNGCKYWYQHGLLHRDNNDEPAVIQDNIRRWYQHGNLYRANGLPAITDEWDAEYNYSDEYYGW